MRLASLLLTAVLGACTSPSTHSALGPDRERVSSSKLPPELHRCLDFQHQLDAIERRFLPPGARDGDPVAAFVAFVESELRLPVRIEDGCTLDPKGCSVALEEVAVGPCSLRHVLNRGNAARGARTAWFADGEQLHLVHARDVDAWIAQLPADSDFLSVRERLLVQWEPARLEGDDAGRLTRDYRSLETGPRVVLRGRLAWRDEQGALRPLEVSTTLLLTLGCRPGVEAWCPDWVTENWTPATGTDLSQCGDSAGDHSFTRELRSSPAGVLETALFTMWLERRPGTRSEFGLSVLLPAGDPVIGGPSRMRVQIVPARVAVDGPTALAPELALLSAVRSSAWMFDDEDFDPIALVQAANTLRALGKQGAIARMHSLLEHSFRYTPNTRTFDGRDPADPATIDPVAVELLVQLMFDVRYTGDVERPVFDEDIEQRAFARFVERGRLHAWAGTYDDAQPGDPPEAQAEYPLRIARDVPFLAAHWLSGRSGCDVSPYFYLDVAERYGVLKSEPLVPPDDPTLAADELLARGPVPERNDPRGQIVRSLERSIGTVFSPRLVDRTDRERHFRRDERISDADWQRVKDDLARRGVRWDAEKQCYFETRR